MNFTVYGLAQTAGSKRHVGNGRIVDSNPKASGWKDTIAEMAVRERDAEVAEALDCGSSISGFESRPSLLSGPLAVEMAFYLPRPKGHYSSRRRTTLDFANGTVTDSHPLLPSAPAHPATRPDVLKLARCVEDALTGVVWRDDAQIVTETLTKRYGEPARVEVRIVAAEEDA